MAMMLEQYRISDFAGWRDSRTLVLNPKFQRLSVWKPTARIFLIDTILRKLPIPKIYMRTFVDRDTRRVVREVVDGQQRLRAILDFIDDKITLSSRAKEFSGLRFSTMTDEMKDDFLQYPIAVDQLINASDQEVLDIFARLNSYSVKLNAPELRHAEFQGDFKDSVHQKAIGCYSFWVENKIFSPNEMLRMYADSYVAEIYGILAQGVIDGGQNNITKIYVRYDLLEDFDRAETESRFDDLKQFITDELLGTIKGTPLVRPAHLLMLMAAVAHVQHGIPQGGIQVMPPRRPFKDVADIRDNLATMADILEQEEEPEGELAEFWRASKSSTQRIASRRVRFPAYVSALS